VKKASTFFTNLFGIIAVLAIMVCAFTACSDGGGSSDNETSVNITVPRVGDLPEFPLGTHPATTREEAESIISDLYYSRALKFIHYNINETVGHFGGNRYTYSFTNDDRDNKIKVSASLKANVNMSESFKEFFSSDYGVESLYWSAFTTSDYVKVSGGVSKVKGILTQNYNRSDVSIAAKSILGKQRNFSENVQITQNGLGRTGKANVNFSENYQNASGFTVTASGNSVKIILDLKTTATASGNNTPFYWLWDEVWEHLPPSVTAAVKYSGSLKIFGEGNQLLIEVPITNYASCEQVLDTIGLPCDFCMLME